MTAETKNPRPLLRRILANVAMFAASTAFAYLIGEFIVRLWFPQPMLPRYVTAAPYKIRMNQPNMSYWHTSPEYHVNIRTNSRGLRSDKEIPYEKPKGTFRIVGLGDSFAMGYEVDLEDTYLYRLEEELRKRGVKDVEVVNLAVSGFGTAEELIALKNEGFKYSPDIVLLGYFVNDIENNIASNLYSLQGDSLKREAAAYLPAMGVRNFMEKIPGYRFLAENSQLLNIFRNRISWLVTQGMFKKNRKLEPEPGDDTKGSMPATTDSATTVYEQRLTAGLLDEIYRECAARSVPFVVLNIPLALSASKEIYSNFPRSWMKYKDSTIVVDAVNIVAPYHHKKDIHFDKWHAHWRPWVHHLAAEVLADTLMSHWKSFMTLREGHETVGRSY